jgi:hypothetical protein
MARCFEHIKRDVDDLALHRGVKRLPAWIAERKVGENEAGDAALLDDVARGADYDRRYAVRFEMTRNQTHGLVANRSKR